MSNMTLGVVASSNKENEHRVPIYPAHFERIPPALRKRIFFETGYGRKFGVEDEVLEKQLAGRMSREELFAQCDIVLLPKPTEGDFSSFREGQVLWGWPHCVQGDPITQVGIDKKMTYIAWECMHHWRNEDQDTLHVFHKNNEMAGYCSVLHALALRGFTGHYGPARKAAVISFGSTGRGSIHALLGMGIHDITLFTQRPAPQVIAPIPAVRHLQYARAGKEGRGVMAVEPDGNSRPMAEELSKYDVIVNCILQDTDRPLDFVTNAEAGKMKPGALIVDVSCDTAMGFEFARPTSFEEPTFPVGHMTYYAVDHTPTYMWESASYEISEALLPYVEIVLGGPRAWDADRTVRKSIEIRDGVIQNQKILSFQNREAGYPHARRQEVAAR